MLIYATPTDLTTWIGTTAPSNALSLLRSASLLVAESTNTAYYDVDGAGMPTDATILGAFRDATCVQAAAWAALGIDPAKAGVLTTGTAVSKHIGTASVTYSDAQSAAAARAQAAVSLVPDAVRVLQLQNLLTARIWTWG